MIRNIVAFILLVGTGGMLLTETIFSLANPIWYFAMLLAALFFIVGVYYHIKGTNS